MSSVALQNFLSMHDWNITYCYLIVLLCFIACHKFDLTLLLQYNIYLNELFVCFVLGFACFAFCLILWLLFEVQTFEFILCDFLNEYNLLLLSSKGAPPQEKFKSLTRALLSGFQRNRSGFSAYPVSYREPRIPSYSTGIAENARFLVKGGRNRLTERRFIQGLADR